MIWSLKSNIHHTYLWVGWNYFRCILNWKWINWYLMVKCYCTIKLHQTEEGIQLIIIWYDGKWVYKYTIWMGFGWRWEENIYEYHYYVILLFIICIRLEQVSDQSLYRFWIALTHHINTLLYFAYLCFLQDYNWKYSTL